MNGDKKSSCEWVYAPSGGGRYLLRQTAGPLTTLWWFANKKRISVTVLPGPELEVVTLDDGAHREGVREAMASLRAWKDARDAARKKEANADEGILRDADLAQTSVPDDDIPF